MHLFPQILVFFCAYVKTSQSTTNVDFVHVSSSLEYWPMRVEHQGSTFETTFDYPITVYVQKGWLLVITWGYTYVWIFRFMILYVFNQPLEIGRGLYVLSIRHLFEIMWFYLFFIRPRELNYKTIVIFLPLKSRFLVLLYFCMYMFIIKWV